MAEDFFELLLSISGIGRSKARALEEAGYSTHELLKRATLEELAAIKGIGPNLARKIKLAVGDHGPEDPLEDAGGLFLCPKCGGFMAGDSDICSNCGADMNQLDDEDVPESEEQPDGGGYWYKDGGSLFLCPHCGAFTSEEAETCPICGADLFGEGPEDSQEEAFEGAFKQAAGLPEPDGADGFWYKDDKPSIYLCPECGAFIGADSTSCGVCGAEFGEEEEQVEEEPYAEPGAPTVAPGAADGFWYKEGEGEEELKHALGVWEDISGPATREDEAGVIFLCPECGALTSATATTCPICSADLSEEAEEEAGESDLLDLARSLLDKPLEALEPELPAMAPEKPEPVPRVEERPEPIIAEEVGRPPLKIPRPKRAPEEPPSRRVTKDFLKRWEGLETAPSTIEEAPERPRERDVEEMLRHYDRLLAADPNLAKAWETKGELLAELGRWEEALECYDNAARVRPEKEDEYKAKVLDILQRSQAPARAVPVAPVVPETLESSLEQYEYLLAKQPDNGRLWHEKGELLEKLGRLEEAIRCYDRAIAMNDTLGRAKDLRARALSKQSQVVYRQLTKEAMASKGRREKGLTNGLRGRVNGLTNGLTNGLRGRVNGLTNGLTNGLRGRVNGLTNGLGRGRVNGLTNGLTRGRVNGLTNGLGRVNGLTNGLTRGRVNGLTNGLGRVNGFTNGRGRINGLTNGLGRVNGFTNGRGRVNGLTNGLGQVNGLVNGRGLTTSLGTINGLGPVDGMVNGLVNGRGITNGNGLINGVGLVNGRGLVNGNGLVNGRGRIYSSAHKMETSSWNKSALVAVMALTLLIIGPVMFTVMYVPGSYEGAIKIDGKFSDWDDIISYLDMAGDQVDNREINLLEYKVDASGEAYSFYLRTEGKPFEAGLEGVNVIHAFLDTDLDPDTGYSIQGIGADHMVELYGWEEKTVQEGYYSFNDSYGPNDWNAFNRHGSILHAHDDDELEFQIPKSSLPDAFPARMSILLMTMDNAGHVDYADATVDFRPGALIIKQTSAAPAEVSLGRSYEPFIRLELDARGGDMTVERLTISLQGNVADTDILGVRVYQDADASGDFDTGSDRKLSERASMINGVAVINLEQPLVVSPDVGTTLFVTGDLSDSIPVGRSVGLVIEDPSHVGVSRGTVTLHTLSGGLSYVGNSPYGIVVDGAFGDWSAYRDLTDKYDDVTGDGNENLDIGQYNSVVGQGNMSFLVTVGGEMLGGTSVPKTYSRPYVAPPDGDHDGLPDGMDPFPDDFDDDGIPDEADPDDDNDDVLDYPEGEDHYLERRDTGARINIGPPPEPDADLDGTPDAKDSYPEDFDNDAIPDADDEDKDNDGEIDYGHGGNDTWLVNDVTGARRYIGPYVPPPHKPRTGEDTLMIYVDSDGDRNTGYRNGPIGIGAEYLLQVTGRGGMVTNSTLFRFNGSHRMHSAWLAVLYDVPVGSDHRRIETQVALSHLPLGAQYSVQYYITDWKGEWGEWDVSDLAPVISRGSRLTRAGETKELYLHPGYGMNTTVGASGTSVTIARGGSQTWTQTPAFAGPFNVTGDFVVHLYIDPQLSGQNKPTVTVALRNGTDWFGEDAHTGLSDPGWYTFSIPNALAAQAAGDAIQVVVNVSSAKSNANVAADIYFGSSAYDSRVVLPTDTLISVDSLETYNSTAQTSIFEPGELVEIQANISDPIGNGDIYAVRINVTDPNGTLVVDSQLMTEIASDANGLWKLYNYTYMPPASGPTTSFEVEVQAYETNHVMDSATHDFVLSTQQGVIFYPDSTEFTDPATWGSHSVQLRNIGNVNDTYEVRIASTSLGWATRLYDGATLIAEDVDGDRDWDTIAAGYDTDADGFPEFFLVSFETLNLTVQKFAPVTAIGETDVTVLNATSTSNSSVFDTVTLNTITPTPAEVKTLHLHAGASMNTTAGTSLSTVNVPAGSSVSWTQAPAFAGDFTIVDYVSAFLYITPYRQGQRWPDLALELSYGGTQVARAVLTDVTTAGWQNLVVATSATIPAGQALTATLSVSDTGTSIDLDYDALAADSRIEFPTTTYIDVEHPSIFNHTMVETDLQEAGQNVTIRANVTDPLGTFDIAGVNITIISPNGTVLVSGQDMTMINEDSGALKFWQLYEYTYALSVDAEGGTYTVNITGLEGNGVFAFAVSSFKLPINVSVEPDHVVWGGPSMMIDFPHWINNTGRAADNFEITVSTEQAWNVTLYADTNGDGIGDVVMATDTNGDGTWDYVNPAYDYDSDGNPDTGKLIKGASFRVVLRVWVPSDFNHSNRITITATSDKDPTVSDSASDDVMIPEFSDVVVPIVSLFVAFGVFRKKRKRKEEKEEEEYEPEK